MTRRFSNLGFEQTGKEVDPYIKAYTEPLAFVDMQFGH
jgi:hypothetical protein